MGKWNTEQIMADLAIILPVIKVEKTDFGGDHDTSRIVLTLGGVEDSLFIRGFDDENSFEDLPDRDNLEVPYVEITDGLSSLGGLTGTDYRLARAYIDVRQYFINRDFEVVNTIDTYF